MIKKERCKICNKKLVNGYCPDCGFQQRYSTAPLEEQAVNKENIKLTKVIWCIISIILILLPALFKTPPLQLLIYGIREQQVITSVPEVTYDDTIRELSTYGDSAEVTLSEGNYIVGVDIPEGTYQADVVSRMASIELDDQSNQINYFSWLHQDSEMNSPYLQDIRLYQGATIYIEQGEILLSSSNAQKDKMLVPHKMKTYRHFL